MIEYFITDADGVVIGEGVALTEADAIRDGSSAGRVHLFKGGNRPVINCQFLRDGTLHDLPERPGPWAKWTGTDWIDPRNAARRASDEAAAIRGERDRLLATSDWTQLPDAPLTAKQRHAWRDYRQALRDAPASGALPDKPE